jgi:hypothetical protein
MRKTTLLLCALTLLLVSSGAMMAHAYSNEGSLSQGYYVTTNWHGINVPTGAAVTATAQTTNHYVDKVTFTWKNPTSQTIWTDTVPVHPDGTYNGKTVYSASSTHTPTEHGNWTVEAKFQDEHNSIIFTWTETVAIKTTQFFVVPEIPIIGTAGASIAMFAGLAIKMKRKPQNPQ